MSKEKKGVIMLVQCLCPNQHVLLSAVYDTAKGTKAQLVYELEQRFPSMGVLPKCAFCGSEALHYAESRLPYNTAEEAITYLSALGASTDREQKRRKEREN